MEVFFNEFILGDGKLVYKDFGYFYGLSFVVVLDVLCSLSLFWCWDGLLVVKFDLNLC